MSRLDSLKDDRVSVFEMIDKKVLYINTGMRCFCGAELWGDVEQEIYICSMCNLPEEECECEEPQTKEK